MKVQKTNNGFDKIPVSQVVCSRPRSPWSFWDTVARETGSVSIQFSSLFRGPFWDHDHDHDDDDYKFFCYFK